MTDRIGRPRDLDLVGDLILVSGIGSWQTRAELRNFGSGAEFAFLGKCRTATVFSVSGEIL